jgi:hypothetical protein
MDMGIKEKPRWYARHRRAWARLARRRWRGRRQPVITARGKEALEATAAEIRKNTAPRS